MSRRRLGSWSYLGAEEIETARAGESIDDCWGGDRKWEGAGGLSGSAGEGRERVKDVIIDDRGPLTAPSGRRLQLLPLLLVVLLVYLQDRASPSDH